MEKPASSPSSPPLKRRERALALTKDPGEINVTFVLHIMILKITVFINFLSERTGVLHCVYLELLFLFVFLPLPFEKKKKKKRVFFCLNRERVLMDPG